MARYAGSSLPLEIILIIISHMPTKKDYQGTLFSAALVSRVWYKATLPRLYKHPHIDGDNFQSFVQTICPSINAHVRKTDLSEMVRVLDMSALVHDSSRSMTARLISRLKLNMEVFVAPCTTFSLNSYSALAKCYNLKLLDLSFVSEYVPLDRLFSSISKLDGLQTLHLSRSTVSDAVAARMRLGTEHMIRGPPNLKRLRISGTMSSNATDLLRSVNMNLEYFQLQTNNLELPIEESLLWMLCPDLKSLEIGPGYSTRDTTPGFPILYFRQALLNLTLNHPGLIVRFQRQLTVMSTEKNTFPLRTLTLNWYEDTSEASTVSSGRIDPEELFDAVAANALPNLHKITIRYPRRLAADRVFRKSLEELSDLLEAMERERNSFDTSTEEESERPKDVGVWLIET